MRIRLRSAALGLLCLGTYSTGCGDASDPIEPTPGPTFSVVSCEEALCYKLEPEIFGNVFDARVEMGGLAVYSEVIDLTLVPDDATRNSQFSYLSPSARPTQTSMQAGELNHAHQGETPPASHWGWWDPSSRTMPCDGGEAGYQGHGPEFSEQHDGGNPEVQELHCAVPGFYTLQIAHGAHLASLPIDYLAHFANEISIDPLGPGNNLTGKVLSTKIGINYAHFRDTKVTIDIQTGQDLTEMPRLSIDVVPAGLDWRSAPMVDAQSPSGGLEREWRFSPAGSQTSWAPGDSSHFLTRIFFDLSEMENPAKRTGFFSPWLTEIEHWAIRAFRYSNVMSPIPSAYKSCKIDVGLEILRPDEVLTTVAGSLPGTNQLLIRTITIESGASTGIEGVHCHEVVQPPNSETLTVTSSGTGGGTVHTIDELLPLIDCAMSGAAESGTCSNAYLENTTVTLRATRDSTSIFTAWGGACSGTGDCTVTMSQARAVTAAFTRITFGRMACAANPNGTAYRYTLNWTASGAAWQVRHSKSDDVDAASLMASGTWNVKVTTPYYHVATDGPDRYWWLRIQDAAGAWTPWIANFTNPQALSDGCLL
jgi:hypothetical protein